MEELIRQAWAIARGMWKYRWTGLITAWVVAVVGVVIVFKIPDRYEASARIYVDTQSILKPLLSGLTVQPNVDQQLAMLSRTLISRPNLEKLVRMADLDLKTDSKVERERLLERLAAGIQIRNTGRDNLYTLVMQEQDQDKAKRIIQSLVSIFVESSLGANRKDADSAKAFLSEQIKNYEARLEEAEGRLKEFRIRNLSMQAADGKDVAGRIGDMYNQLEAAKLQLREAENARDAAKSQLAAQTGGTRSALPNLLASVVPDGSGIAVSTPEVDARIAIQKQQLDNLLQRFTDAHPEVITTRRLIRELEEQRKKEVEVLRKAALAAPRPAGGPGGPTESLAAQELGRMVATAEVQVASLKARVSEYSSRLAQAREALKTAPQIEAEAAQLDRDYNINKKNYEDLVARRQSAIMSGELDVASGVADFRLIDPPRVSPQPVSPNRMALLPLPLVAGVVLGLALAFALSQLRPVFHEPAEMRAKLGLPLLGVVSMTIGESDRRRERMSLLRFAGASGGLVGIFAIGIAVMAVLATRG